MDERVIIACPHCSERFRVRKDVLGRNARCSRCRQIFLLVVPGSIDEDEILSLVTTPRFDRENGSSGPKNATVAGLKVFDSEPESAAAPTAGQPRIPHEGPPLKLRALDAAGCHFFFPSDLLESDQFRSSFPKVCAGCFEKRGLHVYLLRWPLTAAGPAGYGNRHTPRTVAALAELPSVDPVELLKYLPVDADLPDPFRRPFPYYVCGKCKPEGLVYPASVIDQARDTCLLTIANVDLAFEFYTATCGTATADYQMLLSRSRMCKFAGWEALPEQDRRRLSAWFKPHDREQFICYVRDLDSSATRSGETGIIVTNQRVICGKAPLWRQYNFHEHLTVTSQSIPEGTKIDIYSAAQGKVSFRLADASWVNLRHSLDNLKMGVRFLKI